MKSGWVTKKLGDVCELINRGIAPKYIDEGGIQVLNQKCIRDHSVNYEHARRNDLKLKSVPEDRLLRVGDVLVNSTGTGTLGRVAQVRETLDEPTTVDTHVTIVRPKDGKFYLDFFGYALIEIEEEIKNSGAGASGQTELARDVLKNEFTISFPESLDEQQRIVAILDEAFAGIATAAANAEKNLQNARELFESTLQSVFAKKGDGWVESALEEYVRFIDYRGRTPEKTEYGLRLITAKNVKKGFIQLEPKEYVNPDIYDEWMTRGLPKQGDVLFTTEAPLGNVAQLDTDEKVVFAQRIIILQPDRKVIDPTFLKYLLLSEQVQREIHDQGTGATATGIKAKLLKKIKIQYPASVEEQSMLVKKLESLETKCKILEQFYKSKLNEFAELKQSILQKAFAGELH